ncbi:hypothetical protein [Helicobacter pylori]|uniref:hypothetical protein n=1 Tax=Helicobacter pylori TaxID=210 RepID=UPI00046D9E87|nr:hypothetical protein [Helicobacter pylori]
MDEIKTLLVDFFPQAKHFGIIINPACAFLMEPFQKTKFYPIACFKASLLNIRRKDWNFMGKLINLF